MVSFLVVVLLIVVRCVCMMGMELIDLVLFDWSRVLMFFYCLG